MRAPILIGRRLMSGAIPAARGLATDRIRFVPSLMLDAALQAVVAVRVQNVLMRGGTRGRAPIYEGLRCRRGLRCGAAVPAGYGIARKGRRCLEALLVCFAGEADLKLVGRITALYRAGMSCSRGSRGNCGSDISDPRCP